MFLVDVYKKLGRFAVDYMATSFRLLDDLQTEFFIFMDEFQKAVLN